MSYREKKIEAKAELVEEVVEVKPILSFADGICNVCQMALHKHAVGPSGYAEDCNGRPLTFIDEPQAVVLKREGDARKAAEALKAAEAVEKK